MKLLLHSKELAILSFSAIKNNDKVGLILFSDQIEKFITTSKDFKIGESWKTSRERDFRNPHRSHGPLDVP